MKKVLFVCLGNICRSPSAEAVFRKMASKKCLETICDSAGTIDNHVGHKSDPRSIAHAEDRGYEMKHLGRQLEAADLKKFDLIVAMDKSNFKNILKLDSSGLFRNKIKMMTDFRLKMNFDEVPDPYHGTAEDFELVLDILEDSCSGLCDYLSKN